MAAHLRFDDLSTLGMMRAVFSVEEWLFSLRLQAAQAHAVKNKKFSVNLLKFMKNSQRIRYKFSGILGAGPKPLLR